MPGAKPAKRVILQTADFDRLPVFVLILKKLLCFVQRSFSFVRYNLRLFTDTNSVICKIIVGRNKASPGTRSCQRS